MASTQTTGYETCSGDCTSRVHLARRADGKWFTRSQGLDPRYGYVWGKWRETINHDAYADDVQRLRPVAWRLPK